MSLLHNIEAHNQMVKIKRLFSGRNSTSVIVDSMLGVSQWTRPSYISVGMESSEHQKPLHSISSSAENPREIHWVDVNTTTRQCLIPASDLDVRWDDVLPRRRNVINARDQTRLFHLGFVLKTPPRLKASPIDILINCDAGQYHADRLLPFS